jgi:hypothetical protein
MSDPNEITQEPQEVKEPEVQETPQMEPAEPGVGDIMKEGARKAVAALVVFMLIIAYLGGLAYAEVHGLNMLRSGVPEDLLMWAYLGMVTLGVMAIALPLALHYWAFDPLHRIVTFICYGVDISLLGINSFTDFTVNEGQQLVQWAQFYKDFIVPSTPVIAAVMASLLLLLDPGVRAMVLRHSLKAAMMRKQADQILKAANSPIVSSTINAAAQQEVERNLTELFGHPVSGYRGYVMDTTERAGGGLWKSFFGYLSSRVRQMLSSDTDSQAQQ